MTSCPGRTSIVGFVPGFLRSALFFCSVGPRPRRHLPLQGFDRPHRFGERHLDRVDFEAQGRLIAPRQFKQQSPDRIGMPCELNQMQTPHTTTAMYPGPRGTIACPCPCHDRLGGLTARTKLCPQCNSHSLGKHRVRQSIACSRNFSAAFWKHSSAPFLLPAGSRL